MSFESIPTPPDDENDQPAEDPESAQPEGAAEKSAAEDEPQFDRRPFYNKAKAMALGGLGMTAALSGEAAEASNVQETKQEHIEQQSDRKQPDDLAEKKDAVSYKEAREHNEKRETTIEDIQNIRIDVYDWEEMKQDTKSIPKSALQDSSPIEIDGFVSGLFLDSWRELDVRINGRPLTESEGKAADVVEYTTFARNKYTPVARKENLTITIDSEKLDEPLTIEISQDMFEHVNSVTLPYSDDEELGRNIDTTHVTLLNIDKQTLTEQIPDVKKRFKAGAEGAHAVEETFFTNIVDTLGVVESDRKNAFVLHAENKESTMFFYTKLLEAYKQEDIQIVGRHETLHHFNNISGYTFLKDLKSLYDTTDAEILSFINESNFFDMEEPVGHTSDNVDELITSFMNSLMDIEKMEKKFKETDYRGWSGQWPRYSLTEQKKIIDWYQKAIKILRDHARDSIVQGSESFQHDVSFFNNKLEFLGKLENELKDQ